MKRYVSMVLVLLMALTPFTALAQDDMEWETYTSEDELFSVDYPVDWNVSFPEDIPFPAVAFVNGDEDSLARFEADEDIQSGDVAVMILLLPGDLLGMMGLMLEEDGSIADVTDAMVGFFLAPDEDTTEEELAALEVTDAEEIELSDEQMAGFVAVSELDADSGFIIYEPADGIFAILMVSTYTGEYTDDLTDMGKAMALSTNFAGTADDLIAAIMGGAPDSGESEGSDSEMGAGDLDGEALVAERCTTCHTADRIENATKDEAGWTATVDRMIGYGAQLNDAEREAVIAYLSGM